MVRFMFFSLGAAGRRLPAGSKNHFLRHTPWEAPTAIPQ